MNAEKSKTIEPHKFVLNLSHRLDLRSLELKIKIKIRLFMLLFEKNISSDIK